MSWQAMEAVQDCEAIGDHTAYCIMYAIARSADKDGVVGADGRTSSPSMELLADRAHVSKRTLINWIPKLEDMDVLIVERFGKGRGQWNRYTINLPIGESDSQDESYGEAQGSPIDKSYGEIELIVMVQNLQVMVKGLQDMVKVMVHYGEAQGSPDTKETKENNNYYTLAKEFERKTGMPPKPEKTIDWQEKWQVALEAMLSRANSYEHAVETMNTAVDTLWHSDKNYRITSPDSVLKTYLNIIGKQSGNGGKGATRNEDGSYNV